jgi:hypothetical protein
VGARARARLLEHKSDEVFFPQVIRLMGLQHDMQSAAAVEACRACARFYDDMETQLGDGDFLGGTYSFADIAFYMAHVFADRKGAGAISPGVIRAKKPEQATAAQSQYLHPTLGGAGAAGLDVGKGDTANAGRRFAKERCTRIAIIQASVLDACNRPTADVAPVDLKATKRTLGCAAP